MNAMTHCLSSFSSTVASMRENLSVSRPVTYSPFTRYVAHAKVPRCSIRRSVTCRATEPAVRTPATALTALSTSYSTLSSIIRKSERNNDRRASVSPFVRATLKPRTVASTAATSRSFRAAIMALMHEQSPTSDTVAAARPSRRSDVAWRGAARATAVNAATDAGFSAATASRTRPPSASRT